jgi:hypothetical protein
MSISEHFRYRNNVFQSDIFVSVIGMTDVDVGCRISPIFRSMSMPTYDQTLVMEAAIAGLQVVLFLTFLLVFFYLLVTLYGSDRAWSMD